MKEQLRIVEENGKKYLINTSLFNTHRFEIVEKVPKAYEVWNIGDNMMSPDYIPFARGIGNYHIDANSLVAIKLPKEDVQVLRKVATRNTTNLPKIRSRLSHPQRGDVPSEMLFRAHQILEQITE